MKRIFNLVGGLLSLLMLVALGVGLVMLFRSTQLTTGARSPLSTPLPVAQSPLATPTPQPMPTCNAPWPTPPALACPWLPTPTAQPTSSFPTRTPWKPPTPLARTPTALPPRSPARNPSGELLFTVSLPQGAKPSLGHEPGLYHALMNERGQAANLLSKWTLPPDTVIGFARLSASPDGRYLIGIDETEGGDVVYAINSLTGKLMSTLSAGKFFGWHPNSREILFYQDRTSERGLWLFNVESGSHQLIAQPVTIDITGAAISPDGQRLAYGTNTLDVHQIWTANADGSEPHLLLESPSIVAVWDWSPDGKYLLYTGEPTPTVGKGTPQPYEGGILWVMERNGQNRRPLKGPFLFGWGFKPTWSPVGNRVAYVGTQQLDPCWQKDSTYRADPLCRFKGTAIYVEDANTGELHRVASNAIDPVWSPDGSMLALSAMDEKKQIDIWRVHADGLGFQRVTDTTEIDRYPTWMQR